MPWLFDSRISEGSGQLTILTGNFGPRIIQYSNGKHDKKKTRLEGYRLSESHKRSTVNTAGKNVLKLLAFEKEFLALYNEGKHPEEKGFTM